MVKVCSVKALSRYRLALEFSDGTSGVADLSEHVKRKPFLELRDEKIFRRAVLDHGAVEWPCEIGIATEALYAQVHGLPWPPLNRKSRLPGVRYTRSGHWWVAELPGFAGAHTQGRTKTDAYFKLLSSMIDLLLAYHAAAYVPPKWYARALEDEIDLEAARKARLEGGENILHAEVEARQNTIRAASARTRKKPPPIVLHRRGCHGPRRRGPRR